MSGGSWDYAYSKVEEIAQELSSQVSPLRRALGRQLKTIVLALHDIEWVDSGDMDTGKDEEAIREAIGPEREIAELVRDAEVCIENLLRAIANSEKAKR